MILSGAGIDLVGLDGTLYDQILDWIVYLGLEPERFKVAPTCILPASLAYFQHLAAYQASLHLQHQASLLLIIDSCALLQGLEGYDKYFAMARGVEDIGALDMSKYFDTNYHYLMPELTGSSSPNANFGPFLDKVSPVSACQHNCSALPSLAWLARVSCSTFAYSFDGWPCTPALWPSQASLFTDTVLTNAADAGQAWPGSHRQGVSHPHHHWCAC